MPFDDDGEECDFCDLTLEEGESFTEVRLGPLTQPQPVTSRGIQGNTRISSDPKDRLDAILKAMRGMGGLEFEVYEHVEEVKALNGDTHFSLAAARANVTTRHETSINGDKTAAELRFHPEAREHPPDAKLCPRCVELFE